MYYANGYYVAIDNSGYIYYTAGTNPAGAWTKSTNYISGAKQIAYGNGYWVIIAVGTLYYRATDLAGDFTQNTTLGAYGAQTFKGIQYTNGYWCFVSGPGSNTGTTTYSLYRAADPIGSFTSSTIFAGTSLSNAYSAESLYWDGVSTWVATVSWSSSTYYMYSHTGSYPGGTWTAGSELKGSGSLYGIPSDMMYANGYYVACGYLGTSQSYRRCLWIGTSPSNMLLYPLTSASYAMLTIESIAYVNGYWVAGGNDGAIYFLAGASPYGPWTRATISTAMGPYPISKEAYGNGYFLASGKNLGYSGRALALASQNGTYTYIRAL